MVFTTLINGLWGALSKFQSSDFSKQKNTLLIGSAAAAITTTIAVVYGLNRYYSPSGRPELAPALTEEETKIILTAILEKVKLLAAKMVNAAQNIRQQIQAQGQDIEESRVMTSFILPHFKSGYKEIQQNILNEYDVEEYELEDAVKTYITDGDDKIKEITYRIRKMYQTCGGDVELEDGSDDPSSQLREPLSLEVTIEMLSALKEIILARTEEYAITFKDKYGIPEDKDTYDAFSQGLISISQNAEALIEKQYDVSHDHFEKALLKYSNHHEMLEVYITMQHQNNLNLKQHGFKAPGEMM